jgi:hypothetical protein
MDPEAHYDSLSIRLNTNEHKMVHAKSVKSIEEILKRIIWLIPF